MEERDRILQAAAEAAKAQLNGGGGNPPSIQPQPLPMSVQISSMQSIDGKKFVVLNILTPQGQNIYFFDPDGAETIGKGMIDTSRLARTGLEIAGGLS